jgi:hypothetical protein
MRARLALLLLSMFATTGCTQDNPAFDESAGTAATTSDDDPSTNTLSSSEVDSGGQEAPDPVCELQPGVPLEIDLGPAGCADSLESYDRYHPLVGIEGSTLLVGTCPLGALTCSEECEAAIPTPLSFAPLDLTNLAVPGDCLHIYARRQDPNNPDACRFQSVIVETANDTLRRPLLLGRNTSGVVLPPVDNASPLFGFDPVLVPVESCACEEFPDDCCDGLETTRYGLQVGQSEVVNIGETVPLLFGNESYAFTTLDAFQFGECGKPMQEAWGLVSQ